MNFNYFVLGLIVSAMGQSVDVNAKTNAKVSVNANGRLIENASGAEARYYGTNYTMPFAHGYRAMGALGIDRKQAIERDVYHMARMGLNAFRVHLWDAELADSIGNLLANDHLDLLDYLIAQCEQRGIDVILTAQTNFGNGYPERNVDTGSFTYDYDKCNIHEDPAAIAAQRRYVSDLAVHVNPYTHRSYIDDPDIIAIEINNEPCHTSSPKQVTEYINDMVRALRKAGWQKPILYNVSHNMDMVDGYYNADIQGTTYQWYPIGLVAGHERKGNFLPYVAEYNIPFYDRKNFSKMAKVVYEFDPADMIESYLYPAVARTFARTGFQWATQFAYDPIDLARFNTEYQTHYLNLAYTPQKALGMRIARHVMDTTPYEPDAKPANYPTDTVFGDVTVSYRENLAVLNTPTEFVYTNNTGISPIAPDSLGSIAGYGSSAVVKYDGRGAYFIDRIKGSNAWRLEVLPDVVFSADPFAKPSLRREMAHIINAVHPITIALPQLGSEFAVRRIAPESEDDTFVVHNGTFNVKPGVYILAPDAVEAESINPTTKIGNIVVGEFVAPPQSSVPTHVTHSAPVAISAGDSLVIVAEAFAENMPDSLLVYPDNVSFWREHNKLYTMNKIAPYVYKAIIPSDDLVGRNAFRYRIVVPGDKQPLADSRLVSSTDTTFPGASAGNPLDWDSNDGDFYSVEILSNDQPIVLFNPTRGFDGMEISTIPDTWGRAHTGIVNRSPLGSDAFSVNIAPGSDSLQLVMTKYILPVVANFDAKQLSGRKLNVRFGNIAVPSDVTVSLVDRNGATFSKTIKAVPGKVISVNPDEMQLSPTLLVPAPYPVFLNRTYMPASYAGNLNIADVEKVQISIPIEASTDANNIEIEGIWIQ